MHIFVTPSLLGGVSLVDVIERLRCVVGHVVVVPHRFADEIPTDSEHLIIEILEESELRRRHILYLCHLLVTDDATELRDAHGSTANHNMNRVNRSTAITVSNRKSRNLTIGTFLIVGVIPPRGEATSLHCPRSTGFDLLRLPPLEERITYHLLSLIS